MYCAPCFNRIIIAPVLLPPTTSHHVNYFLETQKSHEQPINRADVMTNLERAIFGAEIFKKLECIIISKNLNWHRNTLIYFLNICLGSEITGKVVLSSSDCAKFNYRTKNNGNNRSKINDLVSVFGWLKCLKTHSVNKFIANRNMYTITPSGQAVFSDIFLKKHEKNKSFVHVD